MNNDRLLQAIKTLKEKQDKLTKDLESVSDSINTLTREFDKNTELNLQKLMINVSADLERYSIIDGQWCYNGKPVGTKAEGVDGAQGPEGKPGKDGKDGKPGKDGKNGRDGKNGLDGKPGKDGKDGIDGKDGEAPVIRIGKVESSEENGGAKAILKRKKGTNEYVLDLTLPRGPRGFAGFDGKPGKDGTLVFEELTDEQKEELRGPQGIPGEQGPEGKPGKDGITPDMSNYYNKTEVNQLINDTLGDVADMLREV